MVKDRSDLKKLIQSFKEALQYWLVCLESSNTSLSEIKAAEVTNPLEELDKLAKLIRAHTTKVGIVFKPETLMKSTDAAFNTLQKLSESLVLMISIISQLKSKIISDMFYKEILNSVRLLIESNSHFVDELSTMELNNSEGSKTQAPASHSENEIDGRLVSVGKIWSNCDALSKLVKDGELGVLSKKIKQSIILIEDGLDEFEEWAENPDDFDMDDDPFGFSDDESEEEEVPPTNETSDKVNGNKEGKENLIEFSQLWLSKIKLIKLLLTSVTRSLPSVTSGDIINNIYDVQRLLVNKIDTLVVDLMMSKEVDEESVLNSEDITKMCYKLIKIVKDVNKSNENKIKWCVAWDSKFKEGL